MLKRPRTVLALAAGSLVLGLVAAGAAVADVDPLPDTPGRQHVTDHGFDHERKGHASDGRGDSGDSRESEDSARSEHSEGSEHSGHSNQSGGSKGHGETSGKGHSRGDSVTETAQGQVVSTGSLNIRSKPYLHAPIVGTVQADERIELVCKAAGDPVDGNSLWYRLPDKGSLWVSARYVKNLTTVETCPERSRP